MARDSRPIELLSVFDGIVLICGMVIGAGIFKAPSIVAGAAGSSATFFAAWILGGAVSLCGALVYAELAGRYPETGGEYAFLSRAFGRGVGFIFAWSRITVIQTGAIAAVAFVFGDYASEMLSLGKHGSAIYAAAAVVALTALNVAGTVESKTLQRVMQILLFAGLLFIAVAGFLAPRAAAPGAAAGGGGAFGLAMIFVLLTYGGWNEAAYLAGELVNARRNMLRVLVGGIVALTALYLLVNLGYFAALGLAGMKDSKAVAADVVRAVAGDKGAIVVAIVVCL
ncbi:MAG TPA: amino acid permease, partial [Burkholderiales bacterium]|nr:amino acid permease [Burkholderiales bacterium]